MLDLNAEIDKNTNFITQFSTPLILFILGLIIGILSIIDINGESLLNLVIDYFL